MRWPGFWLQPEFSPRAFARMTFSDSLIERNFESPFIPSGLRRELSRTVNLQDEPPFLKGEISV
jgi:hypothetical protein